MLIIHYGSLGIGAACSAFLALIWQGMRCRRSALLSMSAGIICTLICCLNVSVQLSTAICIVFQVIYLPIVLQPEGTAADAVLAVAIASAGTAVHQVATGVCLNLEVFSLFFRSILIALFLVGAGTVCYTLRGNFPGSTWKECFAESEAIGKNGKKELRKFCLCASVLAIVCTAPAIAGEYKFSVLLLEVVAFFGGITLLNLTLVSYKEKIALMTERQYRDDMQTYMSVIRSQRHDYNFHVQTLHGLFLREDYSEALAYLNNLLQDSVEMNRLLPLSDSAISALILSFQSRAQQKGITMEIVIENDLSRIATNVYETNKVIGNLLQNAIDETEMVEDKKYGIKMSIIKRGEFCIISVSNRARSKQPMDDYQLGKSQKEGHEGIGIASIQALVSKYGGVIYSRMEGEIISFIAKIPLLLIKEDD